MKKLKAYIPLLALLTLVACKKEDSVTLVPYDTYDVSASQGLLKIIYASAYTANPVVRLRVNGKVVSNSIAARTPFPGGGYNTAGSNYPLYLAVPQGADTIAVSIVKVGTNQDSVMLYQTIINIPDNSPYTLHIADTLVNATTNKTISLLVKNFINRIDTGFSRYRFVNLIPNVATTNGAVDLYINGVKLLSNIAYKQASDTFRVATGRNTPGVTNPLSIPTPVFSIYPAGTVVTSTTVPTPLATYVSANTLIDARVYTIFSMGYAGSTVNRLPYLSFTLDKNDSP